MNGPPDPIAIVRSIREADSPAIREIVQRVRRILGFRGYGIPEDDRRELEQVVMTQILKAIRRPDFDEAGFWGFVEVVVSRRCIDWLRRRKPETRLEDAGDVADPSLGPLGQVLEREQRELVRGALARLPEGCRQLIELVTGQGKTYREAASILGRSEGALRVQMYRCIREAREVLAEIQNASGSSRSAKKNPDDL